MPVKNYDSVAGMLIEVRASGADPVIYLPDAWGYHPQ